VAPFSLFLFCIKCFLSLVDDNRRISQCNDMRHT
jgi:hypothetical protein